MRGGVDGYLIPPALEHGGGVSGLATSSPQIKRNDQGTARSSHSVEQSAALVARSRDIEQDDFIRSIAGVGSCTLHRIACVPQVLEPDAFYNPAAVHVKAGDDALGEHLSDLAKTLQDEQPRRPRFFGMKQ